MTGHGTLREIGLILNGEADKALPPVPAGAVPSGPGESEVQFMLRTFTFEENMRIAFVPLVISELAWTYAFRAKRYAAAMRLEEFKRESREIDRLHSLYVRKLKEDLEDRLIAELRSVAEEFVSAFRNDFDILWYSVNNSIKKSSPDISHQPMRTDACISASLIRFLKAYGEATDEIVRRKLHKAAPARPDPAMEGLRRVMGVYSGGVRGGDGGHLKNCMLILNRNLNRIDFTIRKKTTD